MRNQLGQVQDTALEQANGSWPGVAVAVLQLDIDLAHTGAHKGNVNLILADANNKDLAAKLGRPDGSGNAALDTGALHGDGGLNAAKGLDNLLAGVLGRHALDLVRNDARAKLLCKRQAALGNVGNDERAGACGSGTEHGDQTDGAGAADQHRVAELDLGALHAGEGDAQRLEHGAVLPRHVSDLVAPDGRVVDVAAQQAVDRRRGEEGNLFAAVVAARQAGLASVANDVGLDGDAVTDLERGDGRVDSDDFAGRFVAEDVVAVDNHGADAACMPEVDVGAKQTLAPGAHFDLDPSWRELFCYLPADTSCSNIDRNLALLEICAGDNALGRRPGLGYPEVMLGVCKDANIGLERLDGDGPVGR